MTLPVLDRGGRHAEDGGRLADPPDGGDHGCDAWHGRYTYDNHTSRQEGSYGLEKGGRCAIMVRCSMDALTRMIAALDAKEVTRQQLADLMGCSVFSVGRLYRRERELKSRERDAVAELLELKPESRDVRAVPVIGLISAGTWAEAIQQPIGRTYASKGGRRSFALRVDGDSMDLLVMPGANVIVDPDDTDLMDGKAYAVMNEGGEATFKRYRAEPARLEPASSNPKHKTISVGRGGFTIIGRAVQATRDF